MTPYPDQARVEGLIERADKVLDLAERMGIVGTHPTNIHFVAKELLATVKELLSLRASPSAGEPRDEVRAWDIVEDYDGDKAALASDIAAAFAAIRHGERLASPSAVTRELSGWKLVPIKLAPEMSRKLAVAIKYGTEANGDLFPNKVWEEILTASPEPETQPVEGWQPIETAPRDGTQFLACFCKDMGYARVVIEYDADREGEGFPWVAAESNAYHRDAVIAWQRLPSPPKEPTNV